MAVAASGERRHSLLELLGDVHHLGHHVADQQLARGVLGKIGQRCQGLGHPLVADEEGRTGQLLVGRAPEGEAGRQLEPAGRRIGSAQTTQGMPGADKTVGGRPHRPGQEPGHPFAHHGAGRTVGQLVLEEREPLGITRLVAQGVGPGVVGQRGGRWWGVVETGPVAGHPALDGIGPTQMVERLGGHGPVVGQSELAVARCGGGEDGQGVVERVHQHLPSPEPADSQYDHAPEEVLGSGATTIRPSTMGGSWRRRHHCTACGSSNARPWDRPRSPRRWSTWARTSSRSSRRRATTSGR